MCSTPWLGATMCAAVVWGGGRIGRKMVCERGEVGRYQAGEIHCLGVCESTHQELLVQSASACVCCLYFEVAFLVSAVRLHEELVCSLRSGGLPRF